jgi:hypothetical protein
MGKWRSFSHPGPMSTRGLLCRHKQLREDDTKSLYNRVEPIPDSVFQFFINKYGKRNPNNEIVLHFPNSSYSL